MSYPQLRDTICFAALLPDGREKRFSLAEYLTWREYIGMTVPDSKIAEQIAWFNATNNNLGRINCWLVIQQFRKEFPNYTAVARFRLKQEWLDG